MGPVFHRGRLDGSARVLVIGQDPAQHETVVRRILVGEAGHRVQGFLAKLGIDRSYLMVNTYVYSVFGQGRGERHRTNTRIATYRNRWLKAIFASSPVEAVVALGSLAESAWETWKQTADGQGVDVPFVRITHPTQPEASGKPHGPAIAAMLRNWNEALEQLHPLQNRDKQRPLRLYGDAFARRRPARDPRLRSARGRAGLDAHRRRLGRPAGQRDREATDHRRHRPAGRAAVSDSFDERYDEGILEELPATDGAAEGGLEAAPGTAFALRGCVLTPEQKLDDGYVVISGSTIASVGASKPDGVRGPRHRRRDPARPDRPARPPRVQRLRRLGAAEAVRQPATRGAGASEYALVVKEPWKQLTDGARLAADAS